jgi:capsular polysaccharide export protein
MRGLQAFLDAKHVRYWPRSVDSRSIDAVAGWGHKRTARRARAYARCHGLPYLAVEDGFLRSVALGRAAPLSLVVDDVGIYYDATRPSRLEMLLEGRPVDELGDSALIDRARMCRQRIVEAEVSKYNHAPSSLPSGLDGERFVLVVDQTRGDASVDLGLSYEHTFHRMLDAARAENPGARIVVKVHPETVKGRRRGYLAEQTMPPGVEVLSVAVNPIALLKRARRVYVCTSQLGFDALLVGKQVTCFGAPFYAGWGLTDDRVKVHRRGRQRSIDQLVAAALVLYPRYVHPVTDRRCEVEIVLEHLALQRRRFAEHERRFICYGFSLWKRPFVRSYLSAPGGAVRFIRSAKAIAPLVSRFSSSSTSTEASPSASTPLVESKATLVVWASRCDRDVEQAASHHRIPLWRMEDGFLRSVQLGSDLAAPGSLVLDRSGMHYDPSTPSELELLLENGVFTDEELTRARKLRTRIIESGISKYNAYREAGLELSVEAGQRVVLVPGQVADDASVVRGSPRVRDDTELLTSVRELCPGAYVVYKPHPDVISGNRRGALPEATTGLWDQLVKKVPIATCLAAADEVHTMTSLVGFEALLRGLPVTTHGQPFYCGWGLTRDRLAVPRRRRQLSIDELVAGALLHYPLYYSWRAHAFCTAEDMVEELILGRASQKAWSSRLPKAFRGLGSLARLARELTRAA